MNFGWIKRFFKKKNLSNTNTSDLATIDTSFIRIPKLSELSDENVNYDADKCGLTIVHVLEEIDKLNNSKRKVLLKC